MRQRPLKYWDVIFVNYERKHQGQAKNQPYALSSIVDTGNLADATCLHSAALNGC